MYSVPYVSAFHGSEVSLSIEHTTAITGVSGLSLPFESFLSGFKVLKLLSLLFALLSRLSGSPAKSGPLNFGTKNNFPSFFVREKGLAYIYKKVIYCFPVSYFCFATSQNCILAELRLPTVIRRIKFADFVKRATSPKMQLVEFRFHTNSKVHSLP